MSEDRFGEIVDLAARSFNVPPAVVPRDEMWDHIRSARAANQPVPSDEMWERIEVARMKAAQVRATRRKYSIAPLPASGGSGGRRWRHGWISTGVSLLAASLVFVITQIRPDVITGSFDGGGSSPFSAASAEATVGWSNIQFPAAAGFAFNHFASNTSGGWHYASDDDPAVEAYKRAALIHLRKSEALIVGFRTLGAEAATGKQTRTTVRELLSATRLLISAPVSARTQYRGVFQDLEFVLMKMAIVSPETLAADRDQIETTIERRRLLTRMRELMPQPSSSNAN